jgi:transcriptional regulator with XRE-family HTH domain
MSYNQEKEQFAARLNQLCDEKGVPPKGHARQSVIAKRFGVTQVGARRWLEAIGFPTAEKAIQIAIWGGVSYEWLMTGRGQKHLRVVSEKTEQIEQIIEQLSPSLQDEVLKIVIILAGPNWLSKHPATPSRAEPRRRRAEDRQINS